MAHVAEVFILVVALLLFSHVGQRWRDGEKTGRVAGQTVMLHLGGKGEYVWQNINGWIISRGAARNVSYGGATDNLGVATRKGDGRGTLLSRVAPLMMSQ